jgi:hypothetical protein
MEDCAMSGKVRFLKDVLSGPMTRELAAEIYGPRGKRQQPQARAPQTIPTKIRNAKKQVLMPMKS